MGTWHYSLAVSLTVPVCFSEIVHAVYIWDKSPWRHFAKYRRYTSEPLGRRYSGHKGSQKGMPEQLGYLGYLAKQLSSRMTAMFCTRVDVPGPQSSRTYRMPTATPWRATPSASASCRQQKHKKVFLLSHWLCKSAVPPPVPPTHDETHRAGSHYMTLLYK